MSTIEAWVRMDPSDLNLKRNLNKIANKRERDRNPQRRKKSGFV
jgi:hypothetical protein